MPEARFLKEWPLDIWVVTKNGKPDDYAFSRSDAFKIQNRRRKLDPDAFWSVTPAKGVLCLGRLP